jgi:hypothetical protein
MDQVFHFQTKMEISIQQPSDTQVNSQNRLDNAKNRVLSHGCSVQERKHQNEQNMDDY